MDLAWVSIELPDSSVHNLTLMSVSGFAALIRFMNAFSSEEGEQYADGQSPPSFFLAVRFGFDIVFLLGIVLVC